MYNDGWDDWYDDREDAREDWQDNREDLVEERGERARGRAEQRGERRETQQQQRTERQADAAARPKRRRSASSGAPRRRPGEEPGSRRRRQRHRARRPAATAARAARRAASAAARAPTPSPATRAGESKRAASSRGSAAAAGGVAADGAAGDERPASTLAVQGARASCVAAPCSSPAARTAAAPAGSDVSPRPRKRPSALIEAVKANDLDGLVALFGPDGQELVDTSDAADGAPEPRGVRGRRGRGLAARRPAARRKVLVLGNEAWPFPVPLVKGRGWLAFDTAAGREEVLTRRIGRNELAVIRICTHLRRRAAALCRRPARWQARGAYARRFGSDPGRQNGLYWPARRGEPRSPLGDLVAQAAQEGRPVVKMARSRHRSTATTSGS